MRFASKWLEMGRIHTSFVLAEMVQIMFIRDGADKFLVIVPVGCPSFAVPDEDAIAKGVDMTIPDPALGIGVYRVRKVTTVLMTNDELARFAFDQSNRPSVVGDDRGFLAATAMAVTVWDFVGGVVRGMIVHSRFSFQNLLTPPNDSSRCGGNFIGYYQSIIPQMEGGY